MYLEDKKELIYDSNVTLKILIREKEAGFTDIKPEIHLNVCLYPTDIWKIKSASYLRLINNKNAE